MADFSPEKLPRHHDIDHGYDSDESFASNLDEEEEDGTHCKKRRKFDYSQVVLPPGFLDPLPPLMVQPISQRPPAPQVVLPPGFLDPLPPPLMVQPISQRPPAPTPASESSPQSSITTVKSCKQFWKAGDYEDTPRVSSSSSVGGLDHVRVHPKFLHSNATSHKWALGAFAELLDNSVDEICRGATYVNVDVLENKKDGSKMLVVEDNGGGMNVDTIRHCMSFGYSAKSKMGNTIGQYGNGFKTSTMRLGADVIVFSRCLGKEGNGSRPTQSIGLLSYTFLRSTGKDDIVIPIVDYERRGEEWNEMRRASGDDWKTNLETIVQWSPYSSEAELLQQFNLMQDHGTRVLIYNLWEDEQGELEIDVDTDAHDIQLRGVNRDEEKIEMANKFPNSRHFLTYRHSLRSYTSILYLRLPAEFRIALRGKAVDHHNIVKDMMLVRTNTYRPLAPDGVPKNVNVSADVTLGFVKDAKNHLDVQGFNVYHKNRLIVPFWRVWNAAGSDGRGVIGVLEANFVEPAHDKQGFENTPVLQRLRNRLQDMQKDYWKTKCHEIGYAPRTKKTRAEFQGRAQSPPKLLLPGKMPVSLRAEVEVMKPEERKHVPNRTSTTARVIHIQEVKEVHQHHSQNVLVGEKKINLPALNSYSYFVTENDEPKEGVEKTEESFSCELEAEREKCRSLEAQLKEKEEKIKELDKENESLIDIFSEERSRRDNEEANLREKLKKTTYVIEELLKRVKWLEELLKKVKMLEDAAPKVKKECEISAS